jgi:hypothetical protein
MSKRIQIALTDEALQLVERTIHEANDGFDAGRISCADVINEMILCSKVDLKVLQSKRTNVRKSLLLLSTQKGLDLDAAIKALTDLRSRTRKAIRSASDPELLG